MIDRNLRLRYLRNAAQDFLDGQPTLEATIQTVEAVLSVLEDPKLSADFFEDVSDLESVNAELHLGNFDFERYGRDIVEQAAQNIVACAQTHLNAAPSDDDG